MQSRSIPRGFRAALGAAGLIIAAATAMPRAQDPPPLSAPAAPPRSEARWREAGEFVALFAPRIYRDAYRAFVSTLGLDAALRAIAADSATLSAPGAWTARAENAGDAFGEGGTFDHGKVARLYGSRRPFVARGPRGRNGIVEESWTLVSPYPSADLSRLEPGTLLIVLRVP